MNQDKMLTIMEARTSQSGKSLGVKCNDGIWYQTKCWELQGCIGKAVMADTSTSEFNGKTMNWINDYKEPGQAPAQQAPSVTVTPQVTQPPSVNRDASIVAQTLCKSITFSDPTQAFSAYCQLYGLYEDWASRPDVNEQVLQAEAQAVADEFNDDIPF